MACYTYYSTLYSCAILQHKISNFSYSWALLKLSIHAKFRAKKLFMHNFGQNWFRIDTKMMRNLVQNHETVAQENLLFRGNPSFSL